MKSIAFCFILLSTVFLPVVVSASEIDTPIDLQALADKLAEEPNIPGVVLAVCDLDGEIKIEASGYENLKNKIPVTEDSQFFIGSISKNMCSVLILMLQEDGLLSLDYPISKYVEWSRGDEVTIYMLLNHTSGIPDYLSEVFSWSDEKIDEYFREEKSQPEAIEIVRNKDYVYEPGTEQRYSNTNAVLAGMIVVEVTGKPYGQVLDERIFTPLDMDHTYLYGVSTRDYPHVRCYQKPGIWKEPLIDGLFDCTFADENLLDAADGSIISTACDLIKYHRALREGKLLSDESWQLMRYKASELDNGLGYIMGSSKFGAWEGNIGKMNGCTTSMVYHIDSGIHFITMLNSNAGLLCQRELFKWKLGEPDDG